MYIYIYIFFVKYAMVHKNSIIRTDSHTSSNLPVVFNMLSLVQPFFPIPKHYTTSRFAFSVKDFAFIFVVANSCDGQHWSHGYYLVFGDVEFVRAWSSCSFYVVCTLRRFYTLHVSCHFHVIHTFHELGLCMGTNVCLFSVYHHRLK